MINPWLSGQLAKILTRKKRTRKFWNIVFSSFILFILCFSFVFLYRILCDHLVHEEEHFYVGYHDGFLVTEIGSYKIADEDNQKIHISMLKAKAKKGDKIVLSLSKISGELIEVEHFSSTVYKVKTDELGAFILLLTVFFLPFLGLSIFMLIVINIKKPSKKIYDLQKKFLFQ